MSFEESLHYRAMNLYSKALNNLNSESPNDDPDAIITPVYLKE